MPVLISDVDYSEYRILQHNLIHQQKLDSAKGMKKLENDIDIPMKKLIALFALLGCSPMWSCCGFDYDEQPIHKTHEYGVVFVAFKPTPKTANVLDTMLLKGAIVKQTNDTWKWEVWQVEGNIIYLRSDFDYNHEKTQYPWSMKSCIHYPELSLIMIDYLEKAILKIFPIDEFADEVILSDTNGRYKKNMPNWQYPPLEDWIIKKSDYFLDE